MSAIWVEQPPSANAVTASAAIDHSLIVRVTGIRPEGLEDTPQLQLDIDRAPGRIAAGPVRTGALGSPEGAERGEHDADARLHQVLGDARERRTQHEIRRHFGDRLAADGHTQADTGFGEIQTLLKVHPPALGEHMHRILMVARKPASLSFIEAAGVPVDRARNGLMGRSAGRVKADYSDVPKLASVVRVNGEATTALLTVGL